MNTQNPKQELTDLTICRAVFALWVFIYHVDLYLNFSRFLGPAADMIRHGYLGVDGFFILSGLILARVHPEFIGNLAYYSRGRGESTLKWPQAGLLWRFWGKRLARIYPVHLATIIILAALVGTGTALGWTPHDPSRFSVAALIQNLFLVQGWGGSGQGSWNYPSWSVSTEWAGYILFPLLWGVLAYLSTIVGLQILIAGAATLGLVLVFNGYSLNLTFADGLFRFFPEFIIGMTTTRIVRVYADSYMTRRAFLVGGIILGLLSATFGVDLFAVIGLWAVMAAFLMQDDTELPPVLGQRPKLVWLGRRSYAFYMTFAISELLMSQFFQRMGWTPQSHGLVFAAGMLAITLVLAVSLYAVVETPCRRLADRWLVSPVEVTKQENPETLVKG